MRCPTLNELPPPPAGKIGWPWTEESPQLPEAMPHGALWPRVSIVTPSYNQAQFIEETIRSVLLQGYPGLEYILMDGGSTDGSVEVIRKYEPWLACWVSEADGGQADAINKGMQIATGEFVGWLNSDDVYQKSALSLVADMFRIHPKAILVHGDILVTDAEGNIKVYGATSSKWDAVVNWMDERGIAQPAAFWRRSLFEQVGYLRADLRFIMDYEFFLRALRVGPIEHLGQPLAKFRVHETSKTSLLELVRVQEHMQVAREYWPWIQMHAQKNYWQRVRDHYGRCLIAKRLGGDVLTQDGSPRDVIQALCYAPVLLREPWMRKLLIKTVLGPAMTRRARRMIGLK